MFITFEGGEGAGKSSLIVALRQKFEALNLPVIVTREPGGSRLGQKLRDLLLDLAQKNLSPEAELFLYLADRSQHIKEVILPGLSQNKIILCDRYIDSTIAYQGYARELDINQINLLNDFAGGNLKPDLTILLDLPVELGLFRARGRDSLAQKSSSIGRFEAESLDFHNKVRQGFLSLAKDNPERFKIINAEQSPETVLAATWKEIEKLSFLPVPLLKYLF